MPDYDAAANAHWTSKTLVLRMRAFPPRRMLQWDRPGWSETKYGSDFVGELAAVTEQWKREGDGSRVAVIQLDGSVKVFTTQGAPNEAMQSFTEMFPAIQI